MLDTGKARVVETRWEAIIPDSRDSKARISRGSTGSVAPPRHGERGPILTLCVRGPRAKPRALAKHRMFTTPEQLCTPSLACGGVADCYP
ncbi:MAG: hypothetical protein ACXW2C_02940, partial [Acidimicrobiia bacterium]